MSSKESSLTALGAQVRALRIAKGFSQEELAHRSNLHRTYIGMIERGEKNVTFLNILKVSRALDLSPSELLESIR